VRIAAGPDGAVAVDAWDPESRRSVAGRRSPGRGVYLCPERACVERACRARSLERALGREERVPEELVTELLATIEERRDKS
jgi:predicted RNA-binding protein YlxR (DUF448 family)